MRVNLVKCSGFPSVVWRIQLQFVVRGLSYMAVLPSLLYMLFPCSTVPIHRSSGVLTLRLKLVSGLLMVFLHPHHMFLEAQRRPVHVLYTRYWLRRLDFGWISWVLNVLGARLKSPSSQCWLFEVARTPRRRVFSSLQVMKITVQYCFLISPLFWISGSVAAVASACLFKVAFRALCGVVYKPVFGKYLDLSSITRLW